MNEAHLPSQRQNNRAGTSDGHTDTELCVRCCCVKSLILFFRHPIFHPLSAKHTHTQPPGAVNFFNSSLSLTVLAHIKHTHTHGDKHTHTHTHGSKIFISSLIEAVYGSPWQRDRHTQQPGGRTREGRTSFDDPTHRPLSLSLLSLSTPRSPVSSLSHRCLPQWYSIDLLSLPAWQERKDAPRGDGKDIEPPRNEGGRREESEKDVINVTELLVCRRRRHAVTRRRTEARWPFIFI